MGIVDNAVEDGVRNRRLADHLMPARDGQLGGDDGGTALIAFLEEFEQVCATMA